MTGESVALGMKAYSHLSAEERVRIDELRNREGLGVRQIAPRIGRDKSTVSRELKRGLWSASNENDPYRPCRSSRSKTDAWTSRPFHSAMARAEEGRTTGLPATQAHTHGVPAAALPGHGRAQEGIDAQED